MQEFALNANSKINGIYLNTETIELMSIIQGNSISELKEFVLGCEQLHRENINFDFDNWQQEDLENIKRNIFKSYQETLISTEQSVTDRDGVFRKTLTHSGIENQDIEKYLTTFKQNGINGIKQTLATEKPDEYKKNATAQHRFITSERDQMKSVTYEEISELITLLPNHNTILLGSGRYYDITNRLFDENISDMKKYDFYHIQRGLDFAKKNDMQVRYHTLLDKQTLDGHLAGKNKDAVLSELKDYIKESVDFINENHTYKDENGAEKTLITSVDLFNEIISFDPPYVNRWEQEYGIGLDELLEVFKYALDNKPENVTYVYNEPFLENQERRKAVIDLLKQIQEKPPGLIDTLGSQMHIETSQEISDIEECFRDFKTLQDMGFNIQITEFDMCLPESEIFREDGTLNPISDNVKKEKMTEISRVISESGVELEGLTYWSTTDTLDHNVERTNKKTFLAKDFYNKFTMLKNGSIKMEELLNQPYIVGQAEKFLSIYEQEGGIEKLDKIISSRQREVITSRLAGLYSDFTREQEIDDHSILNEAIEATETSTRTGIINEQVGTIKTIQKQKDDLTIEQKDEQNK